MKEISQYNSNDVVLKPSSGGVLYDGFLTIKEYAFEHALFDGGVSETIRREIIDRGHAVAVLPYDPVRDEVLLIEQIRIGALATKNSPWLLECIAGMAEGSTDLEGVARKEAQEEAGLKLNKLHYMRSYLSSPGGSTERLYLYLAEVDLSEHVAGVFGLEEEGEDIKTHVLPFDEAMARLESEEIDNAATVISLQWLALNKSKLATML
ncbi:hypothetical protein N480_24390 [Pseudoalteromonas luteoviolacea S2607]|uniref:NUDIX domain-containing protein n=1 Tax=Pseudoalteromonas luteoviolacea TaxID=43657 RepID=UPI0007B0A846|nr:NUDIX domain-containing protein [Pseudoalteromonas luteoviolacea]KZN33065.1 hypothetical protein N480_24390 [Pseudoalteromonas luteoviolacea S2607]